MLSQKIEAEVDSPGAVNSGVALAEGFWAAGLGGLCHMQMPETHSPACRGYLASVAPGNPYYHYYCYYLYYLLFTQNDIFCMYHWLKMRPFMQCTYVSELHDMHFPLVPFLCCMLSVSRGYMLIFFVSFQV